MKRRCFLAALLCVAVAAVYGSPVEIQAGKTDVKVEFYTPSIVHIVKSPIGHPYTKQSLVVIASPEQVNVTQKGNTLMSDVLAVRVDAKTGAVTFSAKGKTLLREKGACIFEPRTEGPAIKTRPSMA